LTILKTLLAALVVTASALAAAGIFQLAVLPRLALSPFQQQVVLLAVAALTTLIGLIAFLWAGWVDRRRTGVADREFVEQAERESALRGDREELKAHLAHRTEELARLNQQSQQDVSGRIEAERRTAISERRARHLLRHIASVVATLDAGARITFISPSVKTILGYDENELLDQSFLGLVHPDDRKMATEHVAQVIADPALTDRIELRLRRGSGSWAWIEVIGRSLLEEEALGALIVTLRDITARREQQKALRETEERFRLLVQGVRNYAIMFLDPDGRIVSWNEGAERITGYQESEIVGQTLERFYTPQDLEDDRPRKHLEAALAMGRLTTQGLRVRKDGTKYWSEISLTPLFDDQGRHRGFAKITRDITERKATEERLSRSESMLSRAQELAHIGNWEWDIGTGDVTWSDELYRIYGSEPESYRPSYQGYLERIHPEERAGAEAAIRRTMETGEPFAADRRILRPDGSLRWMHATGYLARDAQGRPARMFGTCQDITESKRMENALQIQTELYLSMLNAESELGEGILLAEGDTIVYHNRALASLFGSESVPPRSLRLLFAQGDSPAHGDFLENLEARGERTLPPSRGEMTVRRRDGTWAHIGYIVSSVAGPDRPRTFAVFRDETERRQALEVLETSREQLRRFSSEIERAREEVSARIAREIHDELGQQLTGMKLDLAWLRGHLKDLPEAPDALQRKVQDIADLVDTTVEQVRRIASELRPGVLDDLGLSAALEWQAGEFEVRTGIRCRLICDPHVESLPQDHATAMFRIFQEALTNVARHAGASSVDVSLSIEDRQLRLVVADDGRGIEEEELRSRTSLGLLGMRERAHLLGGETIIRPRNGSGTVVDVTLPLPTNGEPEA
jgi:PAS domain S-box-containing protein